MLQAIHRNGFVLAFPIALTLLSGCNSGTSSVANTNSETTTQSTPAETAETTSVSVTEDESAESPAMADSSLPAPATSAKDVCDLFVNYLAQGNRAMAEQLLTPTALTVTMRAQLQLEPIAGPNAKYQMGEPQYATNKQRLCHVMCTITDSIDGESVESQITWMCRRQKNGWRIAGMLVPMNPGEPGDLLSFENATDVNRIKGSLVSDALEDDAPEFREADAGDGQRRLK